MICGIIDIGSNTIRLSIYNTENKTIKPLLNKKTTAGLSSYIENGYLSKKGVSTACLILTDYKNILSNFNISNVYVFATASLRNISNTEEAVSQIKSQTGILVDVLSGEDEAKLDFIGATYDIDMKDGLLIDIGGGSTEIVEFKNKKILKAVSMPIGSLNLYLNHVIELLPTTKDRRDIKQNVLMELKNIPCVKKNKQKIICGVGGTIRAALKLNNDIFQLPEYNREIDVKNIDKLLELSKISDKTTLRKILQVAPDRVHTIIPGLIILNTIAKSSKSETIIVSNYGVREGYLYKKVQKEVRYG